MAVCEETSQMSYARLTDFRASGTLGEPLIPSQVLTFYCACAIISLSFVEETPKEKFDKQTSTR